MQAIFRVAQAAPETPVLMDLTVRVAASTFWPETHEAIAAAWLQRPAHEFGIVLAAVRREVVEAAGVIDQVVGPFGERCVEDGAALVVHRNTGRIRSLHGPLDRLCREVNGVDSASQACQEGSVPPVSASQLKDVSWSKQAPVEPLNKTLVGPLDEERAWLGAV